VQVQTLYEQLLFSTVRIETQKGTDRHGEATGFIFSYESDAIGEGKAAFFAVTNRHVIEGANEGHSPLSETMAKETRR
jgi:S1-C subfamily serine protease